MKREEKNLSYRISSFEHEPSTGSNSFVMVSGANVTRCSGVGATIVGVGTDKDDEELDDDMIGIWDTAGS